MNANAEAHTPRLEDAVLAWSAAAPPARSDALAALRGEGNGADDGQLVVRWPDAAAKLGVTARTLRYAVAAAGILPVRMPGRGRSIGLRTRDLRALAGLEPRGGTR